MQAMVNVLVRDADGTVVSDVTLKPEDVPMLIAYQLGDSTEVLVRHVDGSETSWSRVGDW